MDPKYNGILWTGGGLLDLKAPRPDMIHPEDIARGLARQFRFSGQTARPYSVLAHSLWAERDAEAGGVSTRARLAVLLHDAAEAYIGDVPTPLKVLLPIFSDIEDRLMAAILARFGLAPLSDEERNAVRIADARAFQVERAVLIPADAWASMGTDMDPAMPARCPEWAADLVAALSRMSESTMTGLFLSKLRELAGAKLVGVPA